MPYVTTCRRCGRAYAERSREAADVPAWAATVADRLCPACWQAARALAELDTAAQADRVLAELARDRYPTAAELDAETRATERAAAEVLRDLAAEASA